MIPDWVQWCTPIVSAAWEAEVGVPLELSEELETNLGNFPQNNKMKQQQKAKQPPQNKPNNDLREAELK